MREPVTIHIQGGLGKTRLHRLIKHLLESRGFKIVNWDTETDQGDYLVVDTSDTQVLLKGTEVEWEWAR
jgi:hypothetical protein